MSSLLILGLKVSRHVGKEIVPERIADKQQRVRVDVRPAYNLVYVWTRAVYGVSKPRPCQVLPVQFLLYQVAYVYHKALL